ncbi:MAG: Peroxisomal membrane protein pex16 [Bathelium mastoideum]|nr:MAG: Peroxisomal membrane protein pex16 [Bathelium mastoideum]
MSRAAQLYRQSTAHFHHALSLLSDSPHLYEEFIAKNASAVSQIEYGLRSLTYIIPGRFRESELASESSPDPHLSFFGAHTDPDAL